MSTSIIDTNILKELYADSLTLSFLVEEGVDNWIGCSFLRQRVLEYIQNYCEKDFLQQYINDNSDFKIEDLTFKDLIYLLAEDEINSL